jgi:hypothetical protein
MTGHHDTCKPKIVFYDKVWYCNCVQCKDKQTEGVTNEEPVPQTVLPEPTADTPARSEAPTTKKVKRKLK